MYLQVYHLISFSSICVRRFFSQPLYLLFTSFVHLLLCLSFLSHLSTTCHVQTFFCCFASSSLQIDSTKIQRLVSLLKVTRLVSLFKVTRLVSWFKVTGLVSWFKITGLVSRFKITGLVSWFKVKRLVSLLKITRIVRYLFSSNGFSKYNANLS